MEPSAGLARGCEWGICQKNKPINFCGLDSEGAAIAKQEVELKAAQNGIGRKEVSRGRAEGETNWKKQTPHTKEAEGHPGRGVNFKCHGIFSVYLCIISCPTSPEAITIPEPLWDLLHSIKASSPLQEVL